MSLSSDNGRMGMRRAVLVCFVMALGTYACGCISGKARMTESDFCKTLKIRTKGNSFSDGFSVKYEIITGGLKVAVPYLEMSSNALVAPVRIVPSGETALDGRYSDGEYRYEAFRPGRQLKNGQPLGVPEMRTASKRIGEVQYQLLPGDYRLELRSAPRSVCNGSSRACFSISNEFRIVSSTSYVVESGSAQKK